MQEKNFTLDELIEQKLGDIFNIENVDIEKLRSILNKPMTVRDNF